MLVKNLYVIEVFSRPAENMLCVCAISAKSLGTLEALLRPFV